MHPGATLLVGPGIVVAEKDAHPFIAASHFPQTHVRVIQRYAGLLDELHAEHASRAIEHGGKHRVQAEVRLHLSIVECVACAAYFLEQVISVPRLYVSGLAERGGLLDQGLPLLFDTGLRWLPNL